jgi:hypothetical protein
MKSRSVRIRYKCETFEFENLDLAISWAKELGEFGTIIVNGQRFVGKFGTDGISNGKLSNGEHYTWKKRRL